MRGREGMRQSWRRLAVVLLFVGENNRVSLAASREHRPRAHFLYTSPSTHKSISVCMCAKCGSTSLFRALYFSIVGVEKGPGPPWVQQFAKWRAPGVRASAERGDVHVHVTRDPLDRYISAFHSKIRCCPGEPPKICFPDDVHKKGESFPNQLIRLSGNSTPVRCLHMADYALALRAVHRAGMQGSLDIHFLPQHLQCATDDRRGSVAAIDASQLAAAAALASENNYATPLVLRGNVSELAGALRNLGGFRFKGGRLNVGHEHHTARTSGYAREYEQTAETWSALCEVSRAEYRALRMTPPKVCADIEKGSSR